MSTPPALTAAAESPERLAFYQRIGRLAAADRLRGDQLGERCPQRRHVLEALQLLPAERSVA